MNHYEYGRKYCEDLEKCYEGRNSLTKTEGSILNTERSLAKAESSISKIIRSITKINGRLPHHFVIVLLLFVMIPSFVVILPMSS